MAARRTTSRRTILASALGACVGVLFGWTGLAGLRSAQTGWIDEEVQRLAAIGGTRAIGAQYLRLRPAEAQPARLLALLQAPEAEAKKWPSAHEIAMRQRADFRDGRVVCVRGWILSETEARLCALAALA